METPSKKAWVDARPGIDWYKPFRQDRLDTVDGRGGCVLLYV